MKHRPSLHLAIFVVLILTTRAVWANGVIRDSIGATSSGRGGANIAHHDNGPAMLSNPASIVNIENNNLFELGVDALWTDLDYSDPESDVNSEVGFSGLPELVSIHRSEDGLWAYGLGIFAPAGYCANWDITNPVLGPRGYYSFGALIRVLPTVAFQATDRLSVGASFGVAASHAELETPFYMQTGILAGTPFRLDLQATGATPTWSAGLQYQLSDDTVIGATYIDECRFSLDGSVNAHVYGLGPTPIASRFDAELDLVWPRSAGVGIMHRLAENQRISADVIWYDWSHAFDKMEMKLTNSSNPLFTGLLGPKITDSIPLKWEDSVSVRVGYEYFLDNSNTLRAGYTYNSRNLPSGTLTPLIPAIMEHSISIGHGMYWNSWRFDWAYQYAFSPHRYVGTSDLVGGDFNNSRLKAQAHWLMFSWLYEF